MGRRMVCAKRRAEASSRGRSLRVLRLVSMSSTIESGNADSLSNTATVWGLPSSRSPKFSFFRPATGAPCSSVTVTNTFTSLTSTLRVVPGFWGDVLLLSEPPSLFETSGDAAFAGREAPPAQGGLGTCAYETVIAMVRKRSRRPIRRLKHFPHSSSRTLRLWCIGTDAADRNGRKDIPQIPPRGNLLT
jgi:hypothetical protein